MKNDPRSCERDLRNCVRSLKKIQDFNGIWTLDLAIPVRHSSSNQLSYEATDVFSGKYVFMCSLVISFTGTYEHILYQLPTSVAS